ncbi:MAG: LysR family transcriptional regulator [Actinomycetota bacterium]
MQLDVEAVRTLMVVLDHGSITKAAQVLHVSRSAASWRIKRLEEHVGQELLVRDGHDLRPTRAARLVLDDARTLIETHDRIARRLDGADLTGSVNVAGDTDTDVATLSRILGSFRRVHPGVEVNLTIEQAPRVRSAIDEGRIDIGLIEGTDDHLRPTDRVLSTDDLVWVTGKCCAHDDGVIPLVTFGRDCFYRDIGEPLLEAAGVEFRVALSIPSSEGVIAAVADGLGVALLRRSWLSDRLAIWAPGDDLPDLPRVHHFARSSDSGSDIVKRLVEVIADEMCAPKPPLTAVS